MFEKLIFLNVDNVEKKWDVLQYFLKTLLFTIFFINIFYISCLGVTSHLIM
jgi:hypothetical protein